MVKAAKRYGVPVSLAYRLVNQESRWNPKARSHVGAIGLTQLMPATAKGLGVDPYNPTQNIIGGMKYLRQQYDRFKDWRIALSGYNCGPEKTAGFGRVCPYRETQKYVEVIYNGE